MDERQIRGYTLTTAVDFLRHSIGNEEAEKLLSRLSAADREILSRAQPVGWYPASLLSAVSAMLAESLGKGDRDKTIATFVDLGRFSAKEATGTFLRLLMRVLTPNLLAKRFPELWGRDCTRGKATVEMSDQRLTFRLSEVDGFDYCGPVAMGWTSFVLECMGKQVTVGDLRGWDVENPGPETVSFEISWT